MMQRIAGALIAVLAGATALAAQGTVASEQDAKNLNLAAYAELLRADIRAEKVAILTELMGSARPRTRRSGHSTGSTTPRWPSSAMSAWRSLPNTRATTRP